MRVLLVAVTLTASVTLAPAHFASRPHWDVGAGRVHACPGFKSPARCARVGSWAATVRWRDCAECLPHRTLARLPFDGIAITLLLGRGPNPERRALPWPPRLRATEATRFEGLPQRIGTIQRVGRLHGFSAYLFVFFGRPSPTPRQLARAEAELDSARLP